MRTAAGIDLAAATALLSRCSVEPLEGSTLALCRIDDDPSSTLGVLPLRHADADLGTLILQSQHPTPFTPATHPLLQELADDLAFGIQDQRLHAQENERKSVLEQTLARLDRSLNGTVAAISAMIELRDPYTAGHERRVATLAAAIGGEMKLDAGQREGIRIGAMIHDIGKIQVPAEILSKPTTLSAVETLMIQGHPEAGYQILSGIDFPWPIALIARQHHERLDGSSYPLGIKGDELILEARIVAVADVVESMSSHRPYRPALPLQAALQEIERGMGTKYDPVAVAACTKLFLESGFDWPTQ